MSKKAVGGFALAACAGIVAATIFAGPAAAGPFRERYVLGLVFMQSNDPAGNSVVAYARHSDGRLTAAGTYATGAAGGLLAGAPDFDRLASQGSVTYDSERKLLYAVNAGSNSVTVFAVHGGKLRRVQVIGSGGVFPVSVAVHRAVAYIVNARDGGSIQGFRRLGDQLIRVPAWHRSLELDTSLTPEFLSTPGDVAFTPSGDKLVVTTKINGNQLDVFNLNRLGAPSRHPVVTPEPGAVPFAVAFDALGHLDVAGAAGSVASYAVNRDGSLALVDSHPTNQQATCWIVSAGDHVFASNTGSDTVSGYTAQPNGIAGLGLTATDAAPTDSAASSDGRYVYIRTGGAGRVDEFAVNAEGALMPIGWVSTPMGIAGDGIAAS